MECVAARNLWGGDGLGGGAVDPYCRVYLLPGYPGKEERTRVVKGDARYNHSHFNRTAP